MSGVAVLLGGSPGGSYCTEVLDHVRIPYRLISDLSHPVEWPAVLVVPAPATLPPAAAQRLHAWVSGGGCLLLCGGPGTLADLAGVDIVGEVTESTIAVTEQPPWLPASSTGLRAFGGARLRPALSSDTDVLGEWTDGGGAITMRSVGRGQVLVVGADVFGSIVRIQQGRPVHGDGVPAADGTAPVDDGVLKVDDGIALSYTDDRALPSGAPPLDGFVHTMPPERAAPIFDRAQADLWRELFLHCLWWSAERAGVAVPWLFYWPAGVPAVGHVSHDSDFNRDGDARAALRAFAAAEITVTWCHCYPGGYSDEVVAAIGAAGHEHALHYNAMGDADLARWGRRYLRAQHAWAQDLAGGAEIVTNKNHYLRWEGGAEFYSWCHELGIRVDQSRGGSKQGNSGFGFGTCHLARPAEDDGTMIDVLMLPLHTMDLEFFAHASIRDVILDEVLARHGVAHFLFHGANLNGRPEVHDSVVALAGAGRERGLRWWTSERINGWERARRGVHLQVVSTAGGWTITADALTPVRDAAILLAVPGLRPDDAVTAEGAAASVTRRHGRPFVELTADLPVGSREFTVRLARGRGRDWRAGIAASGELEMYVRGLASW